jgi:outer membrane protein assembly factor BamB
MRSLHRRVTGNYFVTIIAIGFTALVCHGQENKPADTPPAQSAIKPVAPEKLPGKGLAQHDFFYAGENKTMHMFIVRKGQIVWQYEVTDGRGEISDAMLLSNGSVLAAHQFGISLISSDKRVLWHHLAPTGTEIHTAQMIGKEHVMFVQNGKPAQVFVINISSGKTVRQFELPVNYPESTHTQFRQARLTDAGTLLVAHWDLGKVREYDENGKELNSWDAPGAWSASKLKNGNVLFCAARLVREIDPKGGIVWEFVPSDLPDYQVKEFQMATRLPNGNTLVNNWLNPWSEKPTSETKSVQVWELNPQKEVVWALQSWFDPANLGPATIIQVLDEPSVPEDVHFGSIH